MKKHPIPRPHSHINEIFISRKKPLSVYTKRLQYLIEEGFTTIILHASGMAIPNAITLHNQYRNHFSSLVIDTSTVSTIDTFSSKPTQIRLLPALHIQFNK